MKILFAGIIARYPFGGVTWCSLMYLRGLQALGHEVFYIEDTGEVVYDPVLDTRSIDPSYGTNYIHQALEPFGLGDKWAFVNYDGTYHGQSAETVKRFCADADLYINLSGGSWFWRDEYARIPRSAFIDSDPAFTQLSIAQTKDAWYVDFFTKFNHLFTFGANIGTPACQVPVGNFHWNKTWPPVTLQDWATDLQPLDRFSTVMTWKIESFADVGGNKDQEFVKFIDLPSRTAQPFELAINGPQKLLREHGWSTVDAMGVSRSLWDYREFIQRSRAEFGVAKHTYVATRSGWFSDRTEKLFQSVFLGFQGPGRTNLTVRYYLTNFHNKDFQETENGVTTKPYAGFNVNLLTFSLGYALFDATKGFSQEMRPDQTPRAMR